MPNNSFAVVEAPQVVPPRTGLLASAQEAFDGRWQAGVTFEPVGCGQVRGAHMACAPEELPSSLSEKSMEDGTAVVEYEPYTLWAGDLCSLATFRSRDFVGRATARYLSAESALMAREFWTGDITTLAGTDNFYLENGDAVDLGFASIEQALPWLQQNVGNGWDVSPGIAQNYFGRYMVHAPKNVVSLWLANGDVRREGSLILDHYDNIVVADAGYPAVFDAPPGNGEAGTLAAMIYVTDPVVVRRDSSLRVLPDPNDYAAAMNRDENLVEWRVERMVAAYTANCLHASLLVGLCSTCEIVPPQEDNGDG